MMKKGFGGMISLDFDKTEYLFIAGGLGPIHQLSIILSFSMSLRVVVFVLMNNYFIISPLVSILLVYNELVFVLLMNYHL